MIPTLRLELGRQGRIGGQALLLSLEGFDQVTQLLCRQGNNVTIMGSDQYHNQSSFAARMAPS
jgi:hypothetical protein